MEEPPKLEKSITKLEAIIAGMQRAKANAENVIRDAQEVIEKAREELRKLGVKVVSAQPATQKGESVKSAEGMSTPERIGDCFVEFCKGEIDPSFLVTSLEYFLKQKGLKNFTIRHVYRLTGDYELNFYSNRIDSGCIFFLLTIGEKKYLLPRPVSADLFDSTEGFDGKATPGQLTKFKPAEVVEKGIGWILKEGGRGLLG